MSGKFCVFFLLHNTYYLTVKRTVIAVCQIVVIFAKFVLLRGRGL